MSKIDSKVVLLGKAHVGKTCLVNRYIRGTFDSSVPYQNTIGAAFGSKKETVGGKSIVLGLWDTAGHERYESMVKLYYRDAMAAILCFDLTDKTSFDRIRFWAGELGQMEKDCKLFLCGTKKDLVDDNAHIREVTFKAAKPLADDLQAAIFETSSKSGENIEQLFQCVAKYCIQKKEENEQRQLRGLGLIKGLMFPLACQKRKLMEETFLPRDESLDVLADDLADVLAEKRKTEKEYSWAEKRAPLLTKGASGYPNVNDANFLQKSNVVAVAFKRSKNTTRISVLLSADEKQL